MAQTLEIILQPMHDNGQDDLALCGYEKNRHPHNCGITEATQAIRQAVDEIIGKDDENSAGNNIPKWRNQLRKEQRARAMKFIDGSK